MIEVRESQTHGWGVFASSKILRRALIGVYAGRRYEEGESLPVGDMGITFLFGLSDGGTIDGGDGGNDTRFINHSCRPNCLAVESYDESDRLIVEIRAKRGIHAEEELFLDYALVVSEAQAEDYVCLCGEPTCRGTMAAVTEVA